MLCKINFSNKGKGKNKLAKIYIIFLYYAGMMSAYIGVCRGQTGISCLSHHIHKCENIIGW